MKSELLALAKRRRNAYIPYSGLSTYRGLSSLYRARVDGLPNIHRISPTNFNPNPIKGTAKCMKQVDEWDSFHFETARGLLATFSPLLPSFPPLIFLAIEENIRPRGASSVKGTITPMDIQW